MIAIATDDSGNQDSDPWIRILLGDQKESIIKGVNGKYQCNVVYRPEPGVGSSGSQAQVSLL